MQGFVQGVDRQQATLLPECLDDWVDESNSIRAVNVFVDALDLRDLGFDGVDPAATGRPAYHPSPMLKLYIYGYLNRVQSSRRLEREAGRNLEVMWLTGRLAPDHKTIADFRKDNGPAIKKVCAQFVELCRKMGLLTKASVAIDGSKFKAVNSRDNNFTQGKIQRRQNQVEESVARYVSQLDTADRQTATGEEPSETVLLTKTRLKEKLAKLEEEVKRLAAIEKALLASPDKQISLTDPDCRSMATSGRGSGMIAYNVQSAVDTTNHLIVAHEVTNVGTDRSQLATMAQATKAALRSDHLDVVADRGYFKGEELLATWPELAPGLTPESIKQKYPQTVVSTRIVPGCVQFFGAGKNVFTQSGSKAAVEASVNRCPVCTRNRPLRPRPTYRRSLPSLAGSQLLLSQTDCRPPWLASASRRRRGASCLLAVLLQGPIPTAH